MIYEYAIDPALVADWAIARIGRYVGQFGIDQRRLVSDFPINWEGHVYGELYKNFNDDDSSLEFQSAQFELQGYLQILTEYMVHRNINIPSDSNWLNAAISENAIRPFHAIFTSNKDEVSLLGVISEKNVDNIRDHYWMLPTVEVTKKSAVEIAEKLRPLLQAARKIYIVDPYFDATEERFRKTLIEIANQVTKLPRAVEFNPIITIITRASRHRKRDRLSNDQEKREIELKNLAKSIESNAKEHLSKSMLSGLSVNLVILRNAMQGDQFHNRYLLTDIGGVVIPYGIDEYENDDEYEDTDDTSDDLIPMLKGMYTSRWNQYVRPFEDQKKPIDLHKIGVVLGPVLVC